MQAPNFYYPTDSQDPPSLSHRSLPNDNSPYLPHKDSTANPLKDSQTSQSDMGTPSNVHFQIPVPESDSFKVFVRVRPLDNKEQASSNSKNRTNIIKVEDNLLFVLSPFLGPEWSYKPEKSYVFNKIFEPDTKTVTLYDDSLSVAVQNIINGYNSTILAYGMTGAGKTFTMFGDIYNAKGGPNVHPGIISLMVRDLFSAFEREGTKGFEFSIKLSYLEIYNEQTRDLLSNSTEDLMIVEDPVNGIVIPNLSEFVITSHDDVVRLVLQGNSRRVMGSTHANQFSSRSHAIIQLLVEKRPKTKNIVDSFVQSKLCLVDLAGNERAAVSENRGLRHREGANINRSLLALGNCINILSDPHKKGAFVPYRDSKLTRLLKESLGGNTQTIMLACVSPSYMAYEETVNTLKYASRARNIQRKVVQNVKEVELHISEYKEIIESLRAEVESLKQKLNKKDDQGTESLQTKVSPEYASRVNMVLDELGKRLVTIFEENWEYTQSSNELKALKAQNEELLGNKVHQLGKAVGNVELYNQITDEITALKEVMANNQRIQREIDEHLARSSQEKRLVQSQILVIISQNSQNLEMAHREVCLEEIARNSPLLNLENASFRKMMHFPEENFVVSESKMKELRNEVEEMRKQIAEKDKLLVKNQEIIQSFLHTASTQRPDSANLSSHVSLVPNSSPVREKRLGEHGKESSRWMDLSHQEQDLRAAASEKMINRIPTTVQMTPLVTINTVTSPKITEQFPVSMFTQTSSTASLSKELETRKTLATEMNDLSTQRIPLKTRDTFYNENAGMGRSKIPEKMGDIYISQESMISSIDDLNSYRTQLNRESLENIQKNIPDERNYTSQLYQDRSPQVKQILSPQQQMMSYRVGLSNTKKNVSPATRYRPESLGNGNIPYYEEMSYISDQQKLSKSPQNQINKRHNLIQPNLGDDYSPNISSILTHPQETSTEGSVRGFLLESNNNSNLNKANNVPTKSTNNKVKYDKENLLKRDISPKSALPYTASHNSKLGPQKSPNMTKSTKLLSHKSIGAPSPDSNRSRALKQLRNAAVSPSSLMGKGRAGLPTSPSPDRAMVMRCQNKGMASSVLVGNKQVGQENNKQTYGIVDEPRLIKRASGDSVRKEVKGKRYDGNSKSQAMSPFMLASRNGSHKEYREKKSGYTIMSGENSQMRGEFHSLDSRREQVKVWRTKLHQFASLLENGKMENGYVREVRSLIEEYKGNSQTYPVTVGDMNALKKLEEWLLGQSYFDLQGEILGDGYDGGEVLKTKESMERWDDISTIQEGERQFGGVQDSEKEVQSAVAEEKKRNEETKEGADRVSRKESTMSGEVRPDKKEMMKLYVVFSVIVVAFLFNIFVRLAS